MAIVRAVEQASSLEAAGADLRLEIELPGVSHWVRRRVVAVHASSVVLKGFMPERVADCERTLGGFAQPPGLATVLPLLRGIAAAYLRRVIAPGFCPRR